VSDHQARQKTQSEDAINLDSVISNIVRTTEASGSFVLSADQCIVLGTTCQPSRAATRQASAALPQSLPHRLASRHRSNAVAVPKESSGTRHYCLPFGQAFTNLGLILSNQAADDPSGLDPTSAHD
jgi:hypothetical protein